MPCSGSRKCLHCHTFFKPNPRSKGRQKYCSKSDCQKASKRASQQKWLKKTQNQNYFRGPENIQRVQQWRSKHPGYSRKKPSCSDTASPLQDTLMGQVTDNKEEIADLKGDPLQEVLMAQPFVLIGLIAHLTGSALQDDIVRTSQKLQQLGEDFLNKPKTHKGDDYDLSSHTQTSSGTADPPAL